MDYILASIFAGFFALIYSVFAIFIATRSRRTIYRKIMWGYLATLVVAALVIVVLQLPAEWLAFGAVISSAFGVFGQFGIAVKLGHLYMTDTPPGSHWDGFRSRTDTVDDIRNSANPIHYGARDPLKNW
ncbi:hypothetical protein [Burkholderia cepacia]|uniref:hypothetical protein n=1 Tax=Burkholderia cepacia TaxID=292 RepID=UPI00298F8A4E|nr:hypothetical protein [Burkholderia cepacia]